MRKPRQLHHALIGQKFRQNIRSDTALGKPRRMADSSKDFGNLTTRFRCSCRLNELLHHRMRSAVAVGIIREHDRPFG